MSFANIILPLPLENKYTYRIPQDLEGSITSGCRVIVSFGAKHFYTGLVAEVVDRAPTPGIEYKEIYALLDSAPVLRRPQLRFWEWIASYYICKLGDVYKAALPSGLKLESETTVTLNPDFEADAPLKPTELSVLDALSAIPTKLTASDLARRTGLRNILPILSSLMAKGAIRVGEELRKGYTRKTETFVRIAPRWATDNALREAFRLLQHSPKQEQLLLRFLDLSQALNPTLSKELSKQELLEKSAQSIAVLSNLVKRGILEYYEKEVSRLQRHVCRLESLNPLTGAQQAAYEKILDAFRQHETCLLHGATSSGKTELYIHLIDQVLRAGRQVLYLLPEIAVTTQITERLARVFGDRLLVYHSKFSDNERVEVWNRLLHDGNPLVVLGVRSALFLPFKDLGLIIVDEEHEGSYKQQDPAPRYHARSSALVLANMHAGKTLLGSATPSLDSYFNALAGKFALVELKERYGGALPPEVVAVDTRELKRKKIMKHPLFSPPLVAEMEKSLAAGEQVILFQNRRGFAPMMECRACGWVPRCTNCDVSMTFHKRQGLLVCHYCGYSIRPPQQCPSCGADDFQFFGFGTEQVEESTRQLFPSARVVRMDLDTARTRTAYERIIGDFEQQRTDILIGTQMISKGLDFAHVGVVGILHADGLMNYPDFRAHERAFQLMVQVSGRAGRRDRRGKVILQTAQPEHPLIQMVAQGAYREMADWQLAERSQFRYPPYFRLIVMVLRSRSETLVHDLSRIHAEQLRKMLGDRVLGPVTPPVAFVQSLHIRKIVLKIEIAAAIQPVRDILLRAAQETAARYPDFAKLLVHYDVDPT